MEGILRFVHVDPKDVHAQAQFQFGAVAPHEIFGFERDAVKACRRTGVDVRCPLIAEAESGAEGDGQVFQLQVVAHAHTVRGPSYFEVDTVSAFLSARLFLCL